MCTVLEHVDAHSAQYCAVCMMPEHVVAPIAQIIVHLARSAWHSLHILCDSHLMLLLTMASFKGFSRVGCIRQSPRVKLSKMFLRWSISYSSAKRLKLDVIDYDIMIYQSSLFHVTCLRLHTHQDKSSLSSPYSVVSHISSNGLRASFRSLSQRICWTP